MRVSMSMGAALPAKVKSFTLQQVLSVIGHVCKIQPTDGEIQLSILARALVVAAKNIPGLTERSFFTELKKVWLMADGNDLRNTQMPVGASPIVSASDGDLRHLESAGLQPPGRN